MINYRKSLVVRTDVPDQKIYYTKHDELFQPIST